VSGGAISAFLESGVRFTTPLAYAALGELVVERAGVINIGLEGAIIGGAFGALVFASAGSVPLGFTGAALIGTLIAAIFAFFVVTLRTNQIITGTALSMLGLGLTGTLYRSMYGTAGASLHTPTIAPLAIPGLSAIPFVGAALFDQPVITYALYAIVPMMAWWFYRSTGGLALRAVGERPEAARGAGISPERMRWGAILFGGAMGGISGGTLVLAQVGTFAEGMSAGRGFIAIAIVVLGRWTPWGVAGAAFVFGAASSLQTLAQTTGWAMPYQLPLAFPYVLTLVLLASSRARAASPAALGQQPG
jgi:general nucleoside transport system permease protein